MPQATIEIRFPGKTADEANRLADDLKREIWSLGQDVEVQRKRENPDAQDFGATLILIVVA